MNYVLTDTKHQSECRVWHHARFAEHGAASNSCKNRDETFATNRFVQTFYLQSLVLIGPAQIVESLRQIAGIVQFNCFRYNWQWMLHTPDPTFLIQLRLNLLCLKSVKQRNMWNSSQPCPRYTIRVTCISPTHVTVTPSHCCPALVTTHDTFTIKLHSSWYLSWPPGCRGTRTGNLEQMFLPVYLLWQEVYLPH